VVSIQSVKANEVENKIYQLNDIQVVIPCPNLEIK
jgi:hypothetical protein